MPDPPITVIVPTRERLVTLRETLETVLAQGYPELTIVVSDNASEDGTGDYVRSVGDPRLRYVNPGRRLSMAQNYEFALDRAPRRDGWVMLIGDDDGLLPGAVGRAAELIRELKPEAIRSQPCSYTWPSLTGRSFGRLGVPIGRRIRVRSARRALEQVMRAEASYHELPMIYQGGVLPFALLDRIKAKTGTFFRSCIPDVYSAMAIASSVDRYVLMDEPLAINGLSGNSIGMSQVRDGFANTSAAWRFKNENDIAFHPDVPLRDDGDYPIGQALIYEPFLQSSPLRARPPLTTHFDQLVIALAESSPRSAAVADWARRFASIHGLDLADAERRAVSKGRRLRLRRLKEAVRTISGLYAVGDPSNPVATVSEAARVAGEVRRDVTSRIRLLPNLATRVLARVAPTVSSLVSPAP